MQLRIAIGCLAIGACAAPSGPRLELECGHEFVCEIDGRADGAGESLEVRTRHRGLAQLTVRGPFGHRLRVTAVDQYETGGGDLTRVRDGEFVALLQSIPALTFRLHGVSLDDPLTLQVQPIRVHENLAIQSPWSFAAYAVTPTAASRPITLPAVERDIALVHGAAKLVRVVVSIDSPAPSPLLPSACPTLSRGRALSNGGHADDRPRDAAGRDISVRLRHDGTFECEYGVVDPLAELETTVTMLHARDNRGLSLRSAVVFMTSDERIVEAYGEPLYVGPPRSSAGTGWAPPR